MDVEAQKAQKVRKAGDEEEGDALLAGSGAGDLAKENASGRGRVLLWALAVVCAVTLVAIAGSSSSTSGTGEESRLEQEEQPELHNADRIRAHSETPRLDVLIDAMKTGKAHPIQFTRNIKESYVAGPLTVYASDHLNYQDNKGITLSLTESDETFGVLYIPYKHEKIYTLPAPVQGDKKKLVVTPIFSGCQFFAAKDTGKAIHIACDAPVENRWPAISAAVNTWADNTAKDVIYLTKDTDDKRNLPKLTDDGDWIDKDDHKKGKNPDSPTDTYQLTPEGTTYWTTIVAGIVQDDLTIKFYRCKFYEKPPGSGESKATAWEELPYKSKKTKAAE